MMFYLGIDPGVSGGWAIIDDDCKIFAVSLTKESNILPLDLGGVMAVVEKVHAMPRQGVSSTFTFAENYGFWQGYLTGLNYPYSLVTPQRWQKEILDFQVTKESRKPDESPKQAAARAGRNRMLLKHSIVEFIKRRIPDSSNYIKLKKDQDIADALCLALYARKIYRNAI